MALPNTAIYGAKFDFLEWPAVVANGAVADSSRTTLRQEDVLGRIGVSLTRRKSVPFFPCGKSTNCAMAHEGERHD